MNKRKWYSVLLIGLVILLASPISGCFPAPVPTTTQEPSIPSNFTTYTYEGLFSISYPPDWVPAQSVTEELFEQVMAEMAAEDPTAFIEGITLLFFAGKETMEGWYPNVSIVTDLRSIGYWTLDEVDEATRRYEQENTPGYKELSIQRTKVGGEDVIITVTEDNEPGYEKWRYVQLLTVSGDFAWIVTCSCEAQDYGTLQDTFMSVVRSFRILQ
jgi:hypothetical protein